MMQTVLLDKAEHDRSRFNCGVDALNNYLKAMASQQAKKDNTRTFVLEDESDSSLVIGKRRTNHPIKIADVLC